MKILQWLFAAALLLGGTTAHAQQPASGDVRVGQGAAQPLWLPVSGDCTLPKTAAINCTKLNGVSPGTLFPLNIGIGLASGSGNLNLQTPVSAANGGSGVASPTAHSIQIGEGASAFNGVGPCNANVPVTGQGAASDPQCGGTIPIANGGTGAGTATSAFAALAPTPTRAGDILYWNGSSWTTVAGNNSGTQVLSENSSGVPAWTSAGSGTVTTFSAGTLSPLFTTSVANPTTTPALSFVLTNAGANSWFGNATGSSGAPSYNTWPSCSGNNDALQYTNGTGPTCYTHFADLTLTDQGLTGGATVSPNALTAGTSFTIDCGKSPQQWILNNASFTITPPTVTGTTSQNCAIRIINGSTAANAGTVTFGAGFSGKSSFTSFSTTPTVSAASVTYTNSSATIGWTSNTPGLGSIVFLATTGSLPTNFSTATLYYVVASTASTSIQVSATPGGSAIVAGSAGSGTQTGYVPSVWDLIVNAINGPVFGQVVQVQ